MDEFPKPAVHNHCFRVGNDVWEAQFDEYRSEKGCRFTVKIRRVDAQGRSIMKWHDDMEQAYDSLAEAIEAAKKHARQF